MCSIGGDFKCKDVLPPTPRTGRLGHTTEIVNSMSRRIVPRPTSSLNRKTNWRERIFLRRRAREMLFFPLFFFLFFIAHDSFVSFLLSDETVLACSWKQLSCPSTRFARSSWFCPLSPARNTSRVTADIIDGRVRKYLDEILCTRNPHALVYAVRSRNHVEPHLRKTTASVQISHSLKSES